MKVKARAGKSGKAVVPIQVGKYHKSPELYRQIYQELYTEYSGVPMPAEYAYFVKSNLLRFLIKLARYKFVAKHLKKKDRVLEIGCGSGVGTVFLSQHCAHVTGIDVNEHDLKEAQSIRLRENVTFLKSDFFNHPVREKYDVITATDVIEHMPVEMGRKLIATTCRHLRPNGMLVIGTPSIYSYEYQSAISRASHVKCYDLPELFELVDRYYGRTLSFSMNDEVVHTGHHKMSWYYFILAFLPKKQ